MHLFVFKQKLTKSRDIELTIFSFCYLIVHNPLQNKQKWQNVYLNVIKQ